MTTFAAPPAETVSSDQQDIDDRPNRFMRAWQNPELRDRAKAFAGGVGKAALRGAVEGSGLFKQTDEGLRISKMGVARVAGELLLAPEIGIKDVVTRVGRGAAEGARTNGLQEVRLQAADALDAAADYGKQRVESFMAGPESNGPVPEMPVQPPAPQAPEGLK
jgi:hypothetical protein